MFMKYFLFILLFLFILSISKTRAQTSSPYAWTWTQQSGGTGLDIALAAASDAAGNIYQVGTFTGVAQFGTTSLTSRGPLSMFLAKYSTSGTLLWVRQAGDARASMGSGEAYGFNIAVDGAGRPCVTGTFSGTITFGTTVLTGTTGSTSTFVAQFDAQGQSVWARWGGGASVTASRGIAIDAAGGVYVAGYCRSAMAFGPFTGTYRGGTDLYVVKYAANGTEQWLTTAGGTGDESAVAVAVDATGRVMVGGKFSGTVTVGAYALTSAGAADGLLVQYDAAGAVVWATGMGGPGQDVVNGVALAGGDTWATGNFTNTAAFGSVSLTSAGASDEFVVRYSGARSVQWAQRAGGTGPDYGVGIAVTAQQIAYVSGSFSDQVTVNRQVLQSVFATDAWVIRYSAGGGAESAVGYGGPGNDYADRVGLLGASDIFVTGSFNGFCTFGSQFITSYGDDDAYLSRLHDGTITAVNPDQGAAQWVLFPNPAHEEVQLRRPPGVTASVELRDVLGRTVRHWPATMTSLAVGELPRGVYVVRLATPTGLITKRLVLE